VRHDKKPIEGQGVKKQMDKIIKQFVVPEPD